MSEFLKNTASQSKFVTVIDSATGGGKTSGVSFTYTAAGGSQMALSGTATHKGNGQYEIIPTQAETNVDCFSIGWYGSGVVPNCVTIFTTTKRLRDLQDLAAGEAMTLTEAGILAIWHQLLTGIATAGSVGKLIKDYLDAAITSRSSHDAAAVKTAMEASGTKLTLLEARLTALRAAYLDNLNVGGLLASQADVAAITQAQRVRISLPGQMERPDADSTTYRVYIYAYDEQHKAEDLDANPTVTVENNTGTDRSGNLGTVTKAAGTGIYYVDYTVASTHAIEGVLFKVTAVEGTVSTQYATASIVVDNTAVDFTSGDRSKLESIYGKLPGGTIAAVGSEMALADGAITASKIAADALNGKGDWNTVSPSTPSNVSDTQTAIINAISALNNISSEQVTAAVPTTSAIITALKSSTGWTKGGTWTLAEVVCLLAAMCGLKVIDKAGAEGTRQYLDAEDLTTPVAEGQVSETSPYTQVAKL